MRIAIAWLLGFLLAGCADLKAGYEKELADEQDPTTATVVIGRFFVGNTYGPTVFVNDTPRCSLEDQTYCILRLPPGTYRFRVDIAKYQRAPTLARFRLPSQLALPTWLDAGTITFLRLDGEELKGFAGPGVVGKFFLVQMTKEDFMKKRPRIDRVKAL